MAIATCGAGQHEEGWLLEASLGTVVVRKWTNALNSIGIDSQDLGVQPLVDDGCDEAGLSVMSE
jgi:hypothetical protein